MTLSGTSLAFIPIGLLAAMCIAISLAAASDPTYSTITPGGEGGREGGRGERDGDGGMGMEGEGDRGWGEGGREGSVEEGKK